MYYLLALISFLVATTTTAAAILAVAGDLLIVISYLSYYVAELFCMIFLLFALLFVMNIFWGSLCMVPSVLAVS